MNLREKALHLWDMYSESYNNIIPEYEELLEKKRELGLVLRPIKKTDLREFPKSEFLSITNRDIAKKYLDEKSEIEHLVIIHQVELIVNEDYVYRTLITKVSEYKAEIKKASIKRSAYEYSLADNPPSKFNVCRRTIKGATDDFFRA